MTVIVKPNVYDGTEFSWNTFLYLYTAIENVLNSACEIEILEGYNKGKVKQLIPFKVINK